MPKYKFLDKSLTLRERIGDMLSLLTTEEKIYMLSSCQKAVPRLGIEEWHVGCEVARGYVSRGENGQTAEISTVFPEPIGMAATFDKALMRDIGETAGKDARYYYNKDPHGRLMLWGPTVDMERHPLWGRNEEAYGEDTCLAGEMSREYTVGLAGSSRADEPQGKNILDCKTSDPGVLLRTIPTLKHFCANNNEETRGHGNSNVTEQLLHEYYYRAFKPALTEGGAHSVMAAYNKIGGVPGDMNPDIKNILKDKWGMDLAVTDGGAFSQNLLSHHFTESHTRSLEIALKNGVDVMTDDAEMVAAAAKEGLVGGLISEADIDRAVGASLLGRFRLGEFDGAHKYSDEGHIPDNDSDKALNMRAAEEQVILLKNNGILPLDRSKKQTVLIAGPIADENYRDWYTGTASYAVSIKKAFEEVCDVIYDSGWDTVAVRSVMTGKYLSVSPEGKAAFTADSIGNSEKFELHCWDSVTWNFKALANGKFLQENGEYTAVSPTPYDWFIREWFKVRRKGEYVYFDSWHDDAVYMSGDGALKTKAPCRPTADRLFEIVTLSCGRDRLSELSEKCDRVLLCCGNHPMQVARECYDRHTLDLPPHQHELCQALPGDKLILAIISGYPYAVREETEHSSAVIWSSHCGAPLGTAVCRTVFGENNPAGRCPMTWYSSDSELPPITQYDIISAGMTYMYYEGEPLFPFGFGLSYSEFEYGGFDVSPCDGHIKMSVNVTNISGRDGSEVVQIYYRELPHRKNRSNIRLCGFERVFIASGETVRVNLDIPYERIAEYDSISGEMITASGDYEFMAAASCKDIRAEKTVHINGETPGVRSAGKFIPAVRYDSIERGSGDFSKKENRRYIAFGDWGGSISFDRCEMSGESIALKVSAPCSRAAVEIFADGELIGSCEVLPCSSADDFKDITVPVNFPEDIARISLSVRGQAGLLGFTVKKT